MLRVGPRMGVAAIGLLAVLSFVISSNAKAADDEVCDITSDVALGLEDYRQAIESHLKILRSQPDNALAHYHLGFAYGMVGRVKEELAEYREASRLGLKNWDLFLNLGLAYLGRRELAPATKALEAAVKLGPEHFEAHYNLAIAYESAKRSSEALREIFDARRLAPEDPDVANADSIIRIGMGDIASAQSWNKWKSAR